MKPLNYRIHLEPNLESFTFRGVTEIDIRSEDPVAQITLNANDLRLQNSQVKKGEKYLDCTFSLDPDHQEVTINLPERMGGTIKLIIDYTGQINDLMMGFYRSKYEHDGQERYLAVTQFEEREARRAFPCFDHPSKKATFDVELLIDGGLTGITNTAVIEEEIQPDGRKLVRFERTPRMSTYLLFFGVGEFEFTEDASEELLVRVAATPGKIQYGDFALQMARKSLRFCEEYTGIDFPISKCDHIAIPDFAFGAMENYGAVTYRENLLLEYPGVTSKLDLARMVTVIAHETSHMWFGDLVSPEEWRYVWLNESLATYFTYAISDHYYPDWDLWDLFLDGVLKGMERDSLLGTVPVELPGDREVRLDSSSAPIVYSKGAAILRMLFAHLGEEKCQKGVRHFLDRYKFDCATSQQYWAAFEEATGEPVNRFADSWIYQAGYPIVGVRRKDSELLLTQQRFAFSPTTSDRTWLIPINILLYLKDGETTNISLLLEEKTATVVIPEDTVACKVNSNQTGFYRVRYEREMLNELGRLIREKKLPAIDSLGVENDLFALVRSGDRSLADYLNFIENCFDQEDRRLPLLDISENLMRLYLVIESKRPQIGDVGRRIFEGALEKIGFEPRDDDDLQVSMVRNNLLWSACVFGSEKVAQFGAAKFQALLDGEAVHKDILSSVLKIGAAANGFALEYFMPKLMSADTPETEILSMLEALGCLAEKEKLLKALDFNFVKVPKKNRFLLINAAAENPGATDFMWQWFLENLESLEQLHPMHLGRVIVTLIPICGLGKEVEVKQFFEGFLEKYEMAGDIVRMALESLGVHSRLRNAR